MKVAALVHFAVPFRNAGSETMLHALLKALQTAGHDVTTVTTHIPHAPDNWRWDGLRGLSRRGTQEAAAAVRELAPDVLVTQHHNTATGITLAREIGAKSVFVMHNDFSVNRQLLALGPDLTVFNTEWIAAQYADRAGRSVVVRPPVIAEEHATSPGGCVTLVNLNADKGAGLFYKLARRMPGVPFLGVIGAHGRQIRQRLPNVELLEQTTDMRGEVWCRTRLLLMPSRYESYGMAGVEAMASGIPVLAHPTPGLRESLGDAGIFIERDDIDAWQAMLQLLLHDDHAWADASQRAVKRSAELDPRPALAAWVQEVQEVARDGPAGDGD